MMRALMRVAVVALLLPTLHGCGDDPPPGAPNTVHNGSVMGLVVDDSRKPVVGAAVSISLVPPGEAVSSAVLRSDKAGKFVLSDLATGDYVLEVDAKGFRSQTQKVAAEDHKMKSVTIPLYR